MPYLNFNQRFTEDEEEDKDNNNQPDRPTPAPDMYYRSFLKIDQLLTSQELISQKFGGKPAHDEMLFIIIHQTFELWFKQILYELDSCVNFLNKDVVEPQVLGTVARRLQRVTRIQKILTEQFTVLETMTPLDFLDFRGYLEPASGFQSLQFRILEYRLGLRRSQASRDFVLNELRDDDKQVLLQAEQQPTLFDAVQRWLETLSMEPKGCNLWQAYEKSVRRFIELDRKAVSKAPDAAVKLQRLQRTQELFDSIFDEEKYQETIPSKRRLSHKAFKAALMVHLLRDEPIFQVPFEILSLLIDIDENLTRWRSGHVALVHRIIGAKVGTGGSTGLEYVQETTKLKVFADFYNLSTFLIPRSLISIPPLRSSD